MLKFAYLLPAALLLMAAAAPPPRPITVGGKGIAMAAQKPRARVALPFGTPRTRTLGALAFLGRARPGSSSDCDGGPLSWSAYPQGLTIYFEDGKFAGWWLDGKAATIATPKGIRPGSTKAALRKAYKVESFESSLGDEFSAGDIYGFFDEAKPDRVAMLYAGRACTAR